MNIRRAVLVCGLAVSVTTVFGAARTALYHPLRQTKLHRVSYSSGTKILFVYIGSEDCKFSLAPGFAEMVTDAEKAVAEQAKKQGKPFSTLGVSVGPSAKDGVKYLSRFGEFDQLSSGHGWLNDGALHYVWQDIVGEATVPQIIVLEHDLEALNPGYRVKNDRVLVRVLGDKQIAAWHRDGSRIE